jgi:hypothetical protein
MEGTEGSRLPSKKIGAALLATARAVLKGRGGRRHSEDRKNRTCQVNPAKRIIPPLAKFRAV